MFGFEFANFISVKFLFWSNLSYLDLNSTKMKVVRMI